MKIPRVMSTQHPDNVTMPFFSSNHVLSGDDEVQEAYYVYSHLGIDEQLWDIEGKEVDNYVVQKLLSQYPDYFNSKILGRDKFLTIRVPNPDIEKADGKVLLEIMQSIPRNHDVASLFYGKKVSPVFELVVPMCESEKPLLRINALYKSIISNSAVKFHDISLKEWLGEFSPETIRVTPLFETKEGILNADKYVEKYLSRARVKDLQRVWFARSDPALNYGSVAAVLLVKIGLQRIHKLQEKTGIKILPIIGMGSSPFRGNFTPRTAHQILKGYPSVYTFTAQSAFKYDYPLEEVIKAVSLINSSGNGKPLPIDEKMALKYIDIIEKEYVSIIKNIAPIVNHINKFVPRRRKRKLNIGLFGYSRKNSGVHLPRAIGFCASLYSLGLPPEILGLSNLSREDIERIKSSYANIEYDMGEALQYLNEENLDYFPVGVKEKVLKAVSMFKYNINKQHLAATSRILEALKKGDSDSVSEWVLKAARIRGFLG